MSSPTPSVPSSETASDRTRSTLIFSAIGVLAAIVFGLLYLFVLAPTVPDGSIGWFLFSFATGLTMIVMPCTLPLAFVIVPLSMGKGIIRGLGMALAFGLGVAVMLSTYGIIAAALGGFALEFLGNDIELIKNWVYFFAGSLALVFALSEIGLMNIHMPTYSGAAPAFIQKRGEVIKAFMLGLFLGNVGVGCPHPATPLILIEIATSGDILYGWLMFLVHAIGRVLPLLLLAFMAILGVNGLNWLMSRKAAVERVTGWGMVFVAGFILTLGLFTHDWWVNSGIHSALEAVTQESAFNAWFNEALDQNVAHLHGLEDGVGLFGQPLWWGHYFLVLVWLVPIWWWYRKKRSKIYKSPAFALQRIEKEMDKLEMERSRIEEAFDIDGLDPATDLAAIKTQLAEVKKLRRAAAAKVEYGEKGVYKNAVAREYEVKILGMQRNYLIFVSIALALIFIYFMPTNFFYKSQGGGDHHGTPGAVDTTGIHAMPDGTVMNAAGEVLAGAHVMPDGTIMLADGTVAGGMNPRVNVPENATLFSTETANLPLAKDPERVTLQDGDSYDITAYYVQKEVGNRTLRMMAYNGSVPGPFIRAEQGAEVTINFTNNTDFDQTIHSHGIRIDNLSDGVPGLTQDVVPPGGSYAYTVKFPDSGVYWYHPHTRDDYGQELGLYGNYIVEPEAGYNSPVNREIPLVIDDILINNGKIVDFYKEVTNFALLGRFGNEYLVNGEKNYTLFVNKGEVIRFLVTNVSNARTYNLSIPGAQMKLVGADIGQFEREQFTDDFLISPAERMIVEAYFDKSGTYSLMHTMPSGQVELTRFVVSNDSVTSSYADEFNTLNTNQTVVDEFADFRSYLNKSADKNLLLTVKLEGQVDHSMHTGHSHSADTTMMPEDRMQMIQWDDRMHMDIVNTTENVTWKLIDQDTGKDSMDIPVADWTFKQGDLVKIKLTNDANADHVMQHPIHLHGQQFVVLKENGVPNPNMAWKDTVLVFPGEEVEILALMSNLGEWMGHCHISEHLHAGMMMLFRVEDENGYATGDEYRLTATPTEHNSTDSTQTSTSNSNTVIPSREYTYGDTELADANYRVVPENKFSKAGRKESIQLYFEDSLGNPVNLDDNIDVALTVTFVKSDNSIAFTTYPGNTNFPEAAQPENSNVPGTPGFDESMPHSHSFFGVQQALAHGDTVDDAHHSGNTLRTYSVPAVFPEKGVYRGYVEFILSGETTARVAYFDIEVGSASFSVNDFGWSKTVKWWILLIGSLLLMTPLVLGVRKYINAVKK